MSFFKCDTSFKAWINFLKRDTRQMGNWTDIIISYHLFVQSELWKHQNNTWNLLKTNNKDIRTISMTSFFCYYCQLCADFIYCSDVSIASFKQRDAGLVNADNFFNLLVCFNIKIPILQIYFWQAYDSQILLLLLQTLL